MSRRFFHSKESNMQFLMTFISMLPDHAPKSVVMSKKYVRFSIVLPRTQKHPSQTVNSAHKKAHHVTISSRESLEKDA